MKSIRANKANYGGSRDRSTVKFIVIHYTANDGDTAENNGNYFKNNITKSSAHFFVDQKGNIVKSVPLDHIAWSVGGGRQTQRGGKFFNICKNSNSVSIELCDNKSKDPSAEQIIAVKKVIKYIRKYCKNATIICRHYDVNGKLCPKRMTNDAKWVKFKEQL